MWYEILPGMIIMAGALMAPHVANWGINKIALNGKVIITNTL